MNRYRLTILLLRLLIPNLKFPCNFIRNRDSLMIGIEIEFEESIKKKNTFSKSKKSNKKVKYQNLEKKEDAF